MFKNLFAKYVVAFMAILLLSVLMILVVITSIITGYSEDTKLDLMENTLDSSEIYLEELLHEHPRMTLSELIKERKSETYAMLESFASHREDLTLVLTDEHGEVILAIGAERESIFAAETLPSQWMNAPTDDDMTPMAFPENELFETPHSVLVDSLYDSEGVVCGKIAVCTSSALQNDLLRVLVKTIINAGLLILIATMIAIYLISEKVVRPLRDISEAAKSFAEGKFDVRVPVRGRDEVAQLATAFNQMAESLDNYDTMRNTFMSNVSHDLRTPMTSISGFIDGILDGVIPPERHEYYLQMVSDEVKRLSRLVTTLLDLSRIQAGERKFTMSTFDICEMGRQILISFEQKIDEKNLQVSFECDEDSMSVIADRDAIYQVFYNLCDHAVKFASEGGAFWISIRRLKNRKMLVSVYNEGQGISKEDLPFVFERFYKSDKSRGLNKTGVGLGLFISKTIVEAHGEKIWVESEAEHDCCFNFTVAGE